MKYMATLKVLLAGTLLGCCSRLIALDAGVSFAVFATPEQPYLEVNLEIAGPSLRYQSLDSVRMQASVEILILVRQGDRIANYEKYVLNGPVVDRPQSLLDVKRLMVSNGAYELVIEIQDMNDPQNKDSFKAPLEVNISNNIYLTDIVLLRDFRPDESESPFNKNGLYLEPLPFNFYDRAALTLAFYAEIYHSNTVIKDDYYNLRYLLEEELGNGSTKLVAAGAQRKRPAVIDAIVVPMDISKLKSGNYSIKLELRNKLNELLVSRKVIFQRSNPFQEITEADITDDLVSKQFVEHLGEDSLRYSLRAIAPHIRGDELEILKNLLLPGAEVKGMRSFLFRYFIRRNANNPEEEYRQYMEVVRVVDNQFHSGFRYGFETDRGRIFLKYGRPDDLVHVEDEPSAPPYEIWVYYNFPLTQQNNVKFLFYNPTLAGEDFILLHSTARGEINNPRWERDLYQRNAGQQFDGDNPHDATRMQGNVARNARRFFEDF
jgi:GWxTD domain-containing protein